MSDAVLVAILSLAGTVLGSLIGVLASNKLTNYRIEQLERKVERHNQVVERTSKLEVTNTVIEEKIKMIDHRVDDLERKGKGGKEL